MSSPAPLPAAAGNGPSPVIDVRGLVKRFGGKTVVDHVTMQVARGEISGFLGPNGSGKTTTIRCMCGLLSADEGEGRVLGYDIRSEAWKIKRETGYMTQRFSFYEDLSIRENLQFVARLYGLDNMAVMETLEDLGLSSRRNQLAGTLSGGWKQRLALAACIMHKPQLLLLDEPTAGVDPKARRDFWDEIHALAADGLTVLVSTHYMDEAERCHRINYISYGKLVASGTVDDVLAGAGLTTWVIESKSSPEGRQEVIRGRGDGVARAARTLSGMPGVDQIAPFGTTLHVVGRNGDALAQSVKSVAREQGIAARKGETSLEDVFIQFMADARDNMAGNDGEAS